MGTAGKQLYTFSQELLRCLYKTWFTLFDIDIEVDRSGHTPPHPRVFPLYTDNSKSMKEHTWIYYTCGSRKKEFDTCCTFIVVDTVCLDDSFAWCCQYVNQLQVFTCKGFQITGEPCERLTMGNSSLEQPALSWFSSTANNPVRLQQ